MANRTERVNDMYAMIDTGPKVIENVIQGYVQWLNDDAVLALYVEQLYQSYTITLSNDIESDTMQVITEFAHDYERSPTDVEFFDIKRIICQFTREQQERHDQYDAGVFAYKMIEAVTKPYKDFPDPLGKALETWSEGFNESDYQLAFVEWFNASTHFRGETWFTKLNWHFVNYKHIRNGRELIKPIIFDKLSVFHGYKHVDGYWTHPLFASATLNSLSSSY